MRIEGTGVLDHGDQRVWELISDPEVLASSIPDVIEVKRVSETTYQSTIQESVLRFSVTLATEVELTELEPPGPDRRPRGGRRDGRRVLVPALPGHVGRGGPGDVSDR